jgi:anaerobic magnesium-protoporphyrin IX monomethyl ester cyclase
MKMNVLLIKPFGVADEIIPPISLGYLATQIRDNHDVKIIDALKDNLDAASIANIVAEESVNVVGFQAWSKDIHEIKKICVTIKAVSPGTITIVGGIHPSMVPEGTIKFFGDCLDYAYQGEGEVGFKQFIDCIARGDHAKAEFQKVNGLVWRDDKEIRVNPNCLIKELDTFGFPAWDLMPPDGYPKSPHGAFFHNFPVAPVIITRGCPFPCKFCAAPTASGTKLRYRSVEDVIEELTMLKENYGVNEFHVEDDNFTLNKKFVKKFCERLLSSGLNMSWGFPNGVRLDTMERSLVRLMREAGCYALNFGIESGSPRILKMIKKMLDLEQIEEQLIMVHEEGFDIGGFFIIGFPTETKEEINETIKYACSLPLDRIGVSYFQPFPGTPLYYDLIEKGEIREDWADYNHTSLHNLTYLTPTLTEKELRYFRRKMLLSFYLRPKIFTSMLRQIKSTSHLYHVTKRSIRWLRS